MNNVHKQHLITTINSNPDLKALWLAGWGGRTIEEYLKEYSYIPDIVVAIANDLGIPLEKTLKNEYSK